MMLIATGMKREARVLARDGVHVVAGGGDPARLEAELEAGVAAGAEAILSMGLAGGLAPLLNVGEWVVGTLSPTGMTRREWSVGARQIPRPDREAPAQPVAGKPGSREWIARIAAILPGAVVGRIHADGAMVVTAAQKAQLHHDSRALACDMESHVAARVAARHKLPFAVARVVSDPATRSLPLAAQVAMAPYGGIALGRVLWAVARRPWQVPALTGVAIDAGRAMRELVRGYDMLCRAGFGGPDAGELTLDMG